MSAMRIPLLASYFGQGWAALMAVAFVPVYLRVLGLEAYGVIGVFMFMQTLATLLDFGMTPMINRELALHVAGARSAQSAGDLLKTTLSLIGLCALVLAAGVGLGADWMVREWLRPRQLDPHEATVAVATIGVLVALRLVEGVYRSAMLGLQQHVRLNAYLAVSATARWGGVAVAIGFAPRLEIFFAWQAGVSLATAALLHWQVWRYASLRHVRPNFSRAELFKVWRFAGGVMAATALGVLLTQADKLLLARWLSLENFGLYSTAWTAASALYQLVIPLTQAYFPRFTGLLAQPDAAAVGRTYQQAAQLLALCIVPPAAVLIFFGQAVLQVWLGDAHVAAAAAPVLSWLALGVLMNGLLYVPHVLAMAKGWVRFGVCANVVAVLVYVPVLLWWTERGGAAGAAAAWAALHTLYLLVGMQFFHRWLLPSEKWAWYWHGVLAPLAAAALVCLALRWLWADPASIGWVQLGLAGAGVAAVLLGMMPAARARWRAVNIATHV